MAVTSELRPVLGGTASDLGALVPKVGQIAIAKDTGEIMVGDDVTAFSAGKVGGGGGASTFVGLSDTPANFSGAANQFLAVNAAGDAVEFVPDPGAGSSIWAQAVASIAALKAIGVSGLSAGTRVFVQAYYSGGNTGGGGFVLIDDAGETADDGHVIAPTVASGNKKWLRMGVNRMIANVLNFGARADNGTTDNATAFSNAVTSLRNAAVGPGPNSWDTALPGATLIIPPAPTSDGAYYTSGTIEMDTSTMSFTITGISSARIRSTDKTKEIINIRTISGGPAYPRNLQRAAIVKNLNVGFTQSLSASDTGAIGIELDDVNGGPVHGLAIYNMFFNNVYSAIYGEGNYTMTDLDHIWVQGYAGDAISFQGNVGTNCRISNIFIQGNPNSGKYAYKLKDMHSLIWSGGSIEGQNEDLSNPIGQTLLTECVNVTMISPRWEKCTVNNGVSIIRMNGNTVGSLTVIGAQFTNTVVASGATGHFLDVGYREAVRFMGVFDMTLCNIVGKLNIFNAQGARIPTWQGEIRETGNTGSTGENIRMHGADALECYYADAVNPMFYAENIGANDSGVRAGGVFVATRQCAVTDFQGVYSGTKSSGTLTAQIYIDGSAVASATITIPNGTNPTDGTRFSLLNDATVGSNLRLTRGQRLEVRYTSSSLSTSGGDFTATVEVAEHNWNLS